MQPHAVWKQIDEIDRYRPLFSRCLLTDRAFVPYRPIVWPGDDCIAMFQLVSLIIVWFRDVTNHDFNATIPHPSCRLCHIVPTEKYNGNLDNKSS